MFSQSWALFGIAAYFVVFFGSVVGIFLWDIKRRRERPPVAFKLLRGPGESLRKRIVEFDENLPKFFIISVLPIAAAAGVLSVLAQLTPKMALGKGLAIVGLASLPVFLSCGRYMTNRLKRLRNDSLGYLGERAVGEALEPLREKGYRLFHDIPADVSGKKFNVDHVAVGPSGVFAIETKTRRKGRARAGHEAHKVTYDGRQLIWPWAEDSFGLDQAEARAAWLSSRLNKMTGLGINAQPVLALPGWYVITRALGPVLVLNEKLLVGAISRLPAVLSLQHVDLLSRQLDQLCRDVED